MLGSNFDGERANAAAKATDMLKEAGLTWTDVLCLVNKKEETKEYKYEDNNYFNDRASYIINHQAHKVTGWELNFLESIRHRDYLTERQEAVFNKIDGKLKKANV